MIENLIKDYILFSLIEAYIFCLYFEKIGNCKKFKIHEILLLSIMNCIISFIFPPLLYQFTAIICMGILLKIREKKRNIFDYLKLSLGAGLFLLVAESIICVFYSLILNIDFLLIDKLSIFIIYIPLRIIQIIILYKWRR